MKKQYLVLSGLFAFFGANAQKTALNVSPRIYSEFSKEKPSTAEATPNQKALGTTFYTNDFSNPGDWIINNDGQVGSEFGWSIDAVSDGWWSGANAIQSTSEGNFAELSNGDPTLTVGTQALDVVYTMTSAAPIPLTLGTNIALEFQQYGALFNDLQEILISVDGVNFIAVGNNSDKEILSASGGAAYANPDTKLINLSSFIPAASTQIWLRYQWTTRFPSSATNPNVWVTYGWYIDDIKLSTNADFDLKLRNDYWGSLNLNYFQIPVSQIAPIEFTASFDNNGTQAITNAQYNVTVAPGGFSGSSNAVNIPAASFDSLIVNSTFTPAGLGTYNVTRTLTSTQVDDIPANNVLPNFSFQVVDNIYARDNNVPLGFTNNGTDGFETGNFFDIFAAQDLHAVNVRIATGTTVGTEIYGRIYDASGASFVNVGESTTKFIASGDINNSNFKLYFNPPVSLEADKTYMLMVGSFEGTLRIANAGTSYPQTSFLLDGNDISIAANLFYQTETPFVRMNFQDYSSLSELENVSDFSFYPNPANETASISVELKNAAEVSVSVSDLTGKVVASVPAQTLSSGSQTINFNVGSLAAGMYTYTMKVGNDIVTERFVKN